MVVYPWIVWSLFAQDTKSIEHCSLAPSAAKPSRVYCKGDEQQSPQIWPSSAPEHDTLLSFLHVNCLSLMGGSAVSSGTDLSADVYEPGTDDLLETQAKLQVAVQTLIAGIGEDLQRDGLRDTPKVGAGCIVGRAPILGKPYKSPQSRDILSTVQRVAKAWLDASSGYRKTAKR